MSYLHRGLLVLILQIRTEASRETCLGHKGGAESGIPKLDWPHKPLFVRIPLGLEGCERWFLPTSGHDNAEFRDCPVSG